MILLIKTQSLALGESGSNGTKIEGCLSRDTLLTSMNGVTLNLDRARTMPEPFERIKRVERTKIRKIKIAVRVIIQISLITTRRIRMKKMVHRRRITRWKRNIISRHLIITRIKTMRIKIMMQIRLRLRRTEFINNGFRN